MRSRVMADLEGSDTMNSKPTPKALMPIIAVASVDETRQFYIDALDFDHAMGMVGKDGQLDFCTVTRDGARIMFARSTNGHDSSVVRQPVELYMEVADVGKYFQALSKRPKVKVTEGLTTQWWGDRTFKVRDPN